MVKQDVDVLVVGAGIFGLTMAERLATQLGKKVLVIDSRDHIGGNAYSYFDEATGIEVHQYGAHLFHTDDKTVWRYVNQFTKFTDNRHRVYTTHRRDGADRAEVFPLPVNLGTINQFFHAAYTPEEAKAFIARQAQDNPAAKASREPANLVEQGISLIGKPLFDAFIKNYTAKQWNIPAEKLPASVIKRLPVRYNYNNRYFDSAYEGLPIDGYGRLFDNMVARANQGKGAVEIRLSTNFFDDPDIAKLRGNVAVLIYTGPLDQFYGYQFGALSWRSLRLEKEIVNVHDFQGCPVMNYADLEPKYTRIHEFKHFNEERALDPARWPGYAPDFAKTVIMREYSLDWQPGEEPYYPVHSSDDDEKLAKYQALAKRDRARNIYIGGRLGEYAYFDMDKTFASALNLFKEIKEKA